MPEEFLNNLDKLDDNLNKLDDNPVAGAGNR
jgi:hypothetical protein